MLSVSSDSHVLQVAPLLLPLVVLLLLLVDAVPLVGEVPPVPPPVELPQALAASRQHPSTQGMTFIRRSCQDARSQQSLREGCPDSWPSNGVVREHTGRVGR